MGWRFIENLKSVDKVERCTEDGEQLMMPDSAPPWNSAVNLIPLTNCSDNISDN